MGSSTDIGVALIGYGLFGRHHAQAIKKANGAQLAAISASSAETREAAQRDFPDVRVVSNYQEAVADGNVQLVDVVVPNHLHHAVATASLQSGKHVLLEKPMALNVSHCDQLIQLADDRQLMLAIGHELRLSSLWGEAKRLIDDGAIGQPRHCLVELSRFPYRPGSQGWRYEPDQVGNWILEEPIHFFDLARWYMSACGEPIGVAARANSAKQHPALLDNFSCFVDFADDAYAIVTQTLSAFGHHQTAKVVGDEGTIWAYWSAADARSAQPKFELRYGLGDRVTTIVPEKPAGELLELADELQAVVDCIRTGAPPPCTGNDGRWSTALCLAASESLRTRAAVLF